MATDLCLDELSLDQLNNMTLAQLNDLPLECSAEGPEHGEFDFYSGDALGMGFGSN
jgi:hypothetical protein